MALIQRTVYRVECDGNPRAEFNSLAEAVAAIPDMIDAAYAIDAFAVYPVNRYTEDGN